MFTWRLAMQGIWWGIDREVIAKALQIIMMFLAALWTNVFHCEMGLIEGLCPKLGFCHDLPLASSQVPLQVVLLWPSWPFLTLWLRSERVHLHAVPPWSMWSSPSLWLRLDVALSQNPGSENMILFVSCLIRSWFGIGFVSFCRAW